MARIALIQNLFPILNTPLPDRLTGFSKQLYTKFFEVLVEESGHVIQKAEDLADYQAANHERPDLVICSPFKAEGNPASGFAELAKIQASFDGIPVVVWSTRTEKAVQQGVLEDYKVAAYYTGTLVEAPDEFADLILELL